MKKKLSLMFVILTAAALLLAACGGAAEPAVEEAPADAGEAALTVGDTAYTMSELEGCADCVVAFDDGELRMVLPGFPGNVQVKGVVELMAK